MASKEDRTPPTDFGEELATVKRGARCKLKITLAQFMGYPPFMNLREWAQDDDGAWWPVKGKGIGIRLWELPALFEGVMQAAEKALGHTDDPNLAGELRRICHGSAHANSAEVTQQLHNELHISEIEHPGNIAGWTITLDNRGYYRAHRKLSGKLKSIYLGKTLDGAEQKLQSIGSHET
jgi:hypothetical protein